MKHSKSTMFVGAILFGLSMCFTSCEDILGTWDKPTPAVVTPSEPETPEEKVYSFSLRNLADDADVEATVLTVTDQNGVEKATATSDGKYTIKEGVLSGVTELWFEATTATGKYIAKATVEELPAIAEAGKLKMATVGDVILADGTFDVSTTTGTKVAMIAYLGSDNGESAPYNHGLALAMKDANNGNACKWKTSNDDSGHTKQTDSNNFTSERGLQYNDATHNSDTYPAFKAAIANNGTAAPTGCSSWFLASGYQWTKMFAGDAGGLKTLAGLQSSYYWSSSESEAARAWRFVITSGYDLWNNDSKDSDRLVRACLAF